MSASQGPKLTLATLRVLKVFLDQPDAELFGLEITNRTGIKSGTLYPILIRLEEAGWLESRWDVVHPRQAGRPRRRYYRINGKGQRNAEKELAKFQFRDVMPAQIGWDVPAWNR